MVKSKRKRTKKTVSTRKVNRERSKAAEYVGYLLELHNLQGILLNRLDKEV